MKLSLTLPTLSLMLVAAQAQDICTTDNNVFTVKVDLFCGELGYYTIAECGDACNPTIGIEYGETYTFVQSDISNHYHPIGFAYFPDGAHDDVDELEPSIAQGSDTSCADTLTCPAPMYVIDGAYNPNYYSNIVDSAFPAPTNGIDNFGLDDYEPLFFLPIIDWSAQSFEVKLNFNDESFTDDIFYFCHIHQYMTARIKLLKDGEPVNSDNTPEIEYLYDYERSEETEEDPCLSGHVAVNGREKLFSVHELKNGDEILTEKNGEGKTYQEIYSFGHYNEYSSNNFVVLNTDNNNDSPLEISGIHLLYKNNENTGLATPVRADSLQVGDLLVGSTGEKEVVKDIYEINRQGVYSPLVTDGYFLASGAKVSCYTATAEDAQFLDMGDLNLISHHTLSHIAIAPFRVLCKGADNKFCGERNAEGRLLYAQIGENVASSGNVLLMLVVVLSSFPLFMLEQLWMGFSINIVVMGICTIVVFGMHLTPWLKFYWAKK